jgi:hypothetical protein
MSEQSAKLLLRKPLDPDFEKKWRDAAKLITVYDPGGENPMLALFGEIDRLRLLLEPIEELLTPEMVVKELRKTYGNPCREVLDRAASLIETYI